MKTLRLLLIILTLSAEVSFGTISDTACPDTTCIEFETNNAELQLNQLEAESNSMLAEVPTLQLPVVQKLQKDLMPLQQIQMESQQLVQGQFSSFGVNVQRKLEGRIDNRNSMAGIKF